MCDKWSMHELKNAKTHYWDLEKTRFLKPKIVIFSPDFARNRDLARFIAEKMHTIATFLTFLHTNCKKLQFLSHFCNFYLEMYAKNVICNYLKLQFYVIFTTI